MLFDAHFVLSCKILHTIDIILCELDCSHLELELCYLPRLPKLTADTPLDCVLFAVYMLFNKDTQVVTRGNCGFNIYL